MSEGMRSAVARLMLELGVERALPAPPPEPALTDAQIRAQDSMFGVLPGGPKP